MDSRSRLFRGASQAALLFPFISLFLVANQAIAQSGDSAVTFKSGVNLVMVPVVVRDSRGNVVGNLTKDDFRLFDRGKPQEIQQFTVQKPEQGVALEKPVGDAGIEAAKKHAMVIPNHFVALVFDDVHLKLAGANRGGRNQDLSNAFGYLVYARDAARRYVAKLNPADRVAILTTSGSVALDFTTDRASLEQALLKLRSNTDDAPPAMPSQLFPAGQGPAPVFNAMNGIAERDARGSLNEMQAIVRRMSSEPGERTMVFLSAGFGLDDAHWSALQYTFDLIDNAIRSGVVVNTLNVAGVEGTSENSFENILGLLSYGTGGISVRSNDYDDMLRQVTETPQYRYILGFSPQNLRHDGSQHALKVTLKNGHGLEVRARPAYWDAKPGKERDENAGAKGATKAPEESTADDKAVAGALGIAPEAAQVAGSLLAKADIPTVAPAPVNRPKMSSHEQAVTFQSKVNLVLVPVVVRDSQRHAVGNLIKDDFQLFDRGKLQEIKQFQVEKPEQQVAEEKPAENIGKEGTTKHAMVLPNRFVALVFDDYHLKMPGPSKEAGGNSQLGYLKLSRDAARRYIATLRPGDRVAILTTTGETTLDFTSDRAKIDEALLKLHTTPDVEPNAVLSRVDQAHRSGEVEAKRSLDQLLAFVGRMSAEPGQRIMVLLSTGFELEDPAWNLVGDSMNLIDRAIKSGVVISTLNVRGLDEFTGGTSNSNFPNLPGHQATMANQRLAEEVLFRLADGTGGTYIQDTNDYEGALRRLAEAPEYMYILAFSPQNLKKDGSLRSLKVTLRNGHGLEVQARHSYWDAKPARETAELAGNGAPRTPQESAADEKEVASELGIGQPQPVPARAPLMAKAEPPPAPTIELPAAVPVSPSAPEMSSRDQAVTFQTKVNLVMVPVVVRDSKGQAVGNLKKDDFQLFDKGKKQEIAKFSVEKSGGGTAADRVAAGGNAGAAEKEPDKAATPPENFVAYFFDDTHIKTEDLIRVRDAASRNIDTLQPTDRAAIFTTSGQNAVDFTDDRVKLHDALLKLRPRPLTQSGVQQCPDVSYYMGDLIVNQNDQQALSVATQEAMICLGLPPSAISAAAAAARAAASQALATGEPESHLTLLTLRQVVRRMAAMPGQRNLILATPGFYVPEDLHSQVADAVELALRSNVRVNCLDARGLYTLNPAGDIDQRQYDPTITQQKFQYARQENLYTAGTLGEIADGTGGTFIQNTNDLEGGFRRLATAPEYIYMLGFAPENLKLDGTFHKLNVKLNSREKLSVQARHGYFAPKGKESEAAATKEEIQSAVFSREEIHELPVELNTQFFKPSDTEAKLKVLASVDLKQLQFRKDEGRNRNDLTVVSAVFDSNGNFIVGLQKTVQLRLLDATMGRLQHAPPIKVTSDFDVKPGSYLVRLVVRDSETHLMATENAAVEIP